MLYDRKKKVMLNTKTALFVHKVQDNIVDNTSTTEEKKQSSKGSETLEKDIDKLHNNKDNKV